MILTDYEDPTRRQPPPELPSNDRWDEPEDHCDYIDTLSDNEPE